MNVFTQPYAQMKADNPLNIKYEQTITVDSTLHYISKTISETAKKETGDRKL